MALVEFLLLSFPYALFVFGVNDVYDYATDKLNGRKRLVQGLVLHPRYHRMVMRYVWISGALIMLCSLLTLNLSNIILTVLLLLFSYFYSARPIRLKELPIIDSLSNGFVVLFVSLLGFSFGQPIMELPIKVIFAVICVAGIHALATILDYDADSRAHVKTFATVLGKRSAAFFASVIFVLVLFFSGIASLMLNIYISLCAVSSIILVIHPSKNLALFLSRIIFIGFFVFTILFLIFG